MLYGGKLAEFFVFGLLFFSWVQTSLTPSLKYRAKKGWGLTNTWNFLKAFYRPQSYSCNTVLSNIMWYNVWFCPFCGGLMRKCVWKASTVRLLDLVYITVHVLEHLLTAGRQTCTNTAVHERSALPPLFTVRLIPFIFFSCKTLLCERSV